MRDSRQERRPIVEIAVALAVKAAHGRIGVFRCRASQKKKAIPAEEPHEIGNRPQYGLDTGHRDLLRVQDNSKVA
jgi:hypothetical protein